MRILLLPLSRKGGRIGQLYSRRTDSTEVFQWNYELFIDLTVPISCDVTVKSLQRGTRPMWKERSRGLSTTTTLSEEAIYFWRYGIWTESWNGAADGARGCARHQKGNKCSKWLQILIRDPLRPRCRPITTTLWFANESLSPVAGGWGGMMDATSTTLFKFVLLTFWRHLPFPYGGGLLPSGRRALVWFQSCRSHLIQLVDSWAGAKLKEAAGSSRTINQRTVHQLTSVRLSPPTQTSRGGVNTEERSKDNWCHINQSPTRLEKLANHQWRTLINTVPRRFWGIFNRK